MNILKIIFVLFLVPIMTSSVSHKFYVSTTTIEYVKEKDAIQIISKMFVEDLEVILQERYDPSVVLDPCLNHCQICEREISAVAASSIRLNKAAAPCPSNHD